MVATFRFLPVLFFIAALNLSFRLLIRLSGHERHDRKTCVILELEQYLPEAFARLDVAMRVGRFLHRKGLADEDFYFSFRDGAEASIHGRP
jgi:hypothetical protein